MEQFRKKFIEEATDLIHELEKSLLKLGNDVSNKAIIEQIFRVMHSLKGGSAMFGFHKMDVFTHQLESVYDLVRNDKLKVTEEILSITLLSVDHLKMLLDEDSLSEEFIHKHEALLLKIKQLAIPDSQKQESKNIETHKTESKPCHTKTENATYHIFFRPKEDIFKDGTNPLYLIDELHSLGVCKVIPHFDKIHNLEDLDTFKCYIYWDIFLLTDKESNDIHDVFIFVEDQCELVIEKISDYNLFESAEFISTVNEIVRNQGQFDISQLKAFIENIEKHKKEEKIEKIKKQAAITEKRAQVARENIISSIRVSSDKLDNLMNLVSELVTTQARLSLFAEHSFLPELVNIAENIEKISRNLRDNAFSICLIPLESVMTRFQRLVRDLSSELKKDVAFVTEGAETEFDKTIIEGLTDPIMHILRNSLDHGIEDAATRIKKGKPSQGKILLKAYYSGANVLIKITDDGVGIDTEFIRNKAIAKGFITHEQVLSKKEILDLIFLPGFSTATRVTDVSGRGVGTDVVKRKIAEIRGEVHVDSEVDKGTTITIKLPLTLSIIDGLLVKIENTHFIIPLSVVSKCYATMHDTLLKCRNNLIVLDGEQIPFHYLREGFAMSDNPPRVMQIVVVNYEGVKVGLTFDSIVGEYQAVLKPLGKMYKDQEMISGASILGDGTIALVLDSSKIIKIFSNEK